MIVVQTHQFAGPPSPLATSIVAHTHEGVIVTFSLSGPDAQTIAEGIEQKIKHTKIDSPTSFLSLLERIKEQWGELFGELSALFVQGEKTYLVCFNGEVWLHRGQKFGRVLKSADELKVVEGRALEGDTYYCITQSAGVALSEHFLKVGEGGFPAENLFEYINSDTLYAGLLDRSAVAAIKLVQKAETNPIVTQALGKVPSAQISARVIPFLKRVASNTQALIKNLPTLFIQLKQLRNTHISRESRQKIAVGLIAICLVLAIIAGFFFWRSSENRKGQAFLTPFQLRLADMRSLAETDSVAARDQTLTLQQEFDSAKGNFEKGLFTRNSIQTFSSQLNAFVKEVSGKVELQTLPIFYDFRLVRSDFIATRADMEENIAVFLDQEKQVAISLSVDTKQQTLLPIGQYPVLKDVSFSAQQLYLLADGVYQFPIDSKNEPTKIIEEGDSNRDGKFLRIFGEYFYVFNPEKRNMFRYVIGDDDKASQPIGWFQDKKDLDFPSVNALAVDGTVWMGTDQGQILKYERGNPVDFAVQGMQDPFSSSLKVFTKENVDSIFVLESGKGRAVRILKDGTFVKEIQSPSLGAATEILYSPLTNKAYAVAGSLVYELSL